MTTQVFQVKYEGLTSVYAVASGSYISKPTYFELVDIIRKKFRISAAPEMLQVTYTKPDVKNEVFLISDDEDLLDAWWRQMLNPLLINVNLRGTTDIRGQHTNTERTQESCFQNGCAYSATMELPDGDIEVLFSLVTPENPGHPVPHCRLVVPAVPKLRGHQVRVSIQVVPKDKEFSPVSTQEVNLKVVDQKFRICESAGFTNSS